MAPVGALYRRLLVFLEVLYAISASRVTESTIKTMGIQTGREKAKRAALNPKSKRVSTKAATVILLIFKDEKNFSAFNKMVCRYTALNVLGEGAYGKLYLVEDSTDGTKKALKTSMENPCRDLHISAAETTIHLHVHHPYLMPGLDIFRPSDVDACRHPLNDVTQGLLLPLMEYDLSKIMTDDKNNPRFPQFNALRASWQLACALEALYAAGYAHLDIKPANILQKGDTTYLSDFGLAISNTTRVLERLVITSWWRPPYVRRYVLTPGFMFMAADLFSLGMTFLDITSGTERPDYNTYKNETLYVEDQAQTTNDRVDFFLNWLNENKSTPGFLEQRQKRWRLPLPSVDAFIKYFMLVKAMVSPTPTALTVTEVRMRLEELWPEHPPAPSVRIDPMPPLATAYKEAAQRVIAQVYARWQPIEPRQAPHVLHLFLAVLEVATDTAVATREGLGGHTSWMLPYLFACVNLGGSFYGFDPIEFFRIPYAPENDLLYQDTNYIGNVVSQKEAICAAMESITTSPLLRGQYNFVLPGENQPLVPQDVYVSRMVPASAPSAETVMVPKRPQPSGLAAYQAFRVERYPELLKRYPAAEARVHLAEEWKARKATKP